MKYKDSMAVLQEIANRNNADIAKIVNNIYNEIAEMMVISREITYTFKTDYVDTWIRHSVGGSINFDSGMVYNELLRKFPNLGYNIEYIGKTETFVVSIPTKILMQFAKAEEQGNFDCTLDGI